LSGLGPILKIFSGCLPGPAIHAAGIASVPSWTDASGLGDGLGVGPLGGMGVRLGVGLGVPLLAFIVLSQPIKLPVSSRVTASTLAAVCAVAGLRCEFMGCDSFRYYFSSSAFQNS
jgi:hypothetical protein